MSELFHYFAYGSNLHPVRLESRIGACELIGVACLEEATLSFQKIGLDRSGKCDIVFPQTGATGVWGIVYQISAEQKLILDQHESLGAGYQILETQVRGRQQHSLSVYTYQAMTEYVDPSLKPFCWYHELVVQGACFHGFPKDYLQRLQQTHFDPDPDQDRVSTHARLLTQIRATPMGDE